MPEVSRVSVTVFSSIDYTCGKINDLTKLFLRVELKKNILLISLLLLLNLCLKAQNDTIIQRIVLIGDAGQLTDGRHPVVDAVRDLIPLDKKTTVLFLGDNLYKFGLPDNQTASYVKARAVLDSQLSVADNTPAKVIMIPGNHDWENGGRGGFDAIIRQQLYVDFLDKKNVSYFPKEGCPGPVEISLGDDVTLIIFDSQWWLHPYDKPEIESDCPCKTKDELVTQIKDIAAKNSKKLILLACHHPFKSNGPHGGFFTLKQHLFPFTDINPKLYIPLPVIGSAYPIARSVFGTPQDLRHPNYANMIEEISAAIKAAAPNVVFVSGHEHNLEHIKEGNYNYIISGGGCKTNRASDSKKSLFISPSVGFSVMEVSQNKNVIITFYTVTDSVRKPYTAKLLNFSKDETGNADSGLITNISATTYPDTISTAASKNFQPVKGLKKFFMGQNYRQEWSAPVNMKVFNLEKSGLTITGLGGGKQTKSLRLKDNTGKEWVLRSMNKNPTLAIPGSFRNNVATDLVKELSSASHPYGALIVPALAQPLNIPVPHPELFFVPDDPRLQEYRKDFANKVCMLEERLTTSEGKQTKSSSGIFNKMIDDNDHRPDQVAVLRARLLDMLIGDFDRHFGQWKWSVTDTGKGKIYSPIPRDRDQAFFYSDGQMLKLLSGRLMPFLKGFRHDIPDVDWLGYSAKDFDRVFLTGLNAETWEKAIADFQMKLTDSVIGAAVKNLPPEIYAIDGEKIIQKLISRRNSMTTKAMAYYNFISKKVNVLGSNKKEYFKVSSNGNGLQVRVYARGKRNDTSFIMYNRVFNPAVTKEIRLFGLNDDDMFEIEENASSRIKIRIIGGKGNDTFDIRGHVTNLLYDRKEELNYIKNSHHSKNRFSSDQSVDDSRSILGFNYNTSKFPQWIAGYNSDDGFLAGIGLSKRTYGFRNLPYATDQKFSALYSTRGAYHFDYLGEFNHITRNADIVIKGKYSSPALKKFFGLGNNTKAEQLKDLDYYCTRYKELELEALFRHRYFEKLHLSAGPYFYQYQNNYKENSHTILSKPGQVGLDSANIFSQKKYIGGKLSVLFNNQSNELFPTRGISWNTELVSIAGINKGTNNYTRLISDMSIYASQNDPAKVVAVLKFGGGHIFNNHFEYFQAMDLGADNFLRGFRKNRYAGGSSAYGSFELRVKLFDLNSYILPGPFWLSGFYDAGRVWMKNEKSKTWHGSFGGGLYFIPFNLFVLSASAGFSPDERVFNFSLGSKINLTF